MARYVDIEKTIIDLKSMERAYDGISIIAIVKHLEELPIADAQEARRGRWIPERPGAPARCSLCNTPALWEHGEDDYGYAERRCASHYCPNCGAKMDGNMREVENA